MRVKVSFLTANRTEFDGVLFEGIGEVDFKSEGYVYGRLLDGRPFMCNESDIEEVEDGKGS